ncbi:flagellar motor switch protein FliM [Tersicoccus sp. Bi-70]|uniref:flagellar motor switch protein FliM n=1 Tax=Tersicoccus sp. Bi-70 TaxID=1897634 RepID=UPI0009786D82|nr:flagellar motor switch protein FliM [Tersicoccus sp. Bi-70]OMH30565.1 hypothetical protein BGP79_11355 [Tersicoccus sp. Bi-70]
MSVQEAESAVEDRQVAVYDFRRPTTLARRHSRILELGFETFARQWGTQLTARVRVTSTVGLQSLIMQTYDEYAASLPATTAMVLCVPMDSEDTIIVQFPTAAALGWIARMLGGTGERQDADRIFTPVEKELVQRLINEALEDLHYSLGHLLPGSSRVESIQHHPQFAQAAAPGDVMIVATFIVRVAHTAAPATVVLPASVLLPRLGAVNPTIAAADAPGQVRAQLAEVPVDVAVTLTPRRVTSHEVLRLAVGDTVMLPHGTHQPFRVTVDGVPLAGATATRTGARTGALIISTEENPR